MAATDTSTATEKSTTTNRNGARPAYIRLGVDERGAHHCYDTRTETIHIVHDDGSRERKCVGQNTVDDWMDTVRTGWGWEVERYGVGLVGMLADSLEGQA